MHFYNWVFLINSNLKAYSADALLELAKTVGTICSKRMIFTSFRQKYRMIKGGFLFWTPLLLLLCSAFLLIYTRGTLFDDFKWSAPLNSAS